MLRQITALILGFLLTAGVLSARGGGGCLAEGTLVATPNGDVAIEQLRPGDIVWGTLGNQLTPVNVVSIYSVEPTGFVELATSHGTVITATPEHPFAIAPGVFVRADQLVAGDGLLTLEGNTRLISALTIPADRPAYNLTVAPGGVFFSNGVLVHNKGCFLPETPILLADGTRRPISTIRRGDRVLAFDADGHTVPARVQEVLTHEVENYLVVRTEHVELHVTDEHPFFVGNGTFKTVGSLHLGDTVWVHDGKGGLTPQRLLAIERVKAHVTVYNLHTEEPHTYFADGIAVHNKGGGCFAAGTLISTPKGPCPIEALTLDDVVLAQNTDGEISQATVKGVYLNFAPLLTLSTSRGVLLTTDEHPLLSSTGDFLRADAFVAGDALANVDGTATLLAIEHGTERVPVYTLSVGEPHTFIANGFVAHNKGGGGFHSSGFSSGGYHGGVSSGVANPIPTAAILVIVVVVILISKATQQNDDATEELDYSFSRSQIEGKAAKTLKLLTFIARQDDKWAIETLRAEIGETFKLLQRCWSARDYTPMKTRVMPDLYGQHSLQLAGMRQNHEINLLDQLDLEAIDIVQIHYTDRVQNRSCTALITARARDYYIDDRSRAFLRGDLSAKQFQEFWTFQLHEGRWLLREIEQTRESDALTTENLFEQFTDVGRDQIYGETAGESGPAGPDLPSAVLGKGQKIERLLNFLVQTDPIWNREEMLSTGRRTALNVLLAWQDGRPEMLTGIALAPEMVSHLRQIGDANQATGTKVEYRNLCLRKIEVVHVDNRNDRAQDNFTTRVSLHAQVIISRSGVTVRHDPDVQAWVEFWTFGRDNRRWVLKEILPDTEGESILSRENVDEGSSAQMLEWYYSKTRAT